MILVELNTIVNKTVWGTVPNKPIHNEAKSTTNIRAHIDKKNMESCESNFESNQKLVKSKITHSAPSQRINIEYFYNGVGG